LILLTSNDLFAIDIGVSINVEFGMSSPFIWLLDGAGVMKAELRIVDDEVEADC